MVKWILEMPYYGLSYTILKSEIEPDKALAIGGKLDKYSPIM